jgi:riboflavin biosynthesis pyrimidine reductase
MGLLKTFLNEKTAATIFRPAGLKVSASVLEAGTLVFGEKGMGRLVGAGSPGPLFSRLLVFNKTTKAFGTVPGDYKLPKEYDLLVDIDYFAFNFLRAVSNASLTTGANLRSEKELSVSLQGIGKEGLIRLRSELKTPPPVSPVPVLLTRGTDIDFEHTFFNALDDEAKYFSIRDTDDVHESDMREGRAVAIMTNLESAESIRATNKARLGDGGIVLWPVEDLTAKKAIDFLSDKFGDENRVLVEAGPSLADSLLEREISTLFLTVLEEDSGRITEDSLPFFDQGHIRNVCGFELLHECRVELDDGTNASYLTFARRNESGIRPTFYYKSKPVRAAGMLLKKGNTYLLRRCKGKWSDVGGKTDAKDSCALDTMVREAVEETNGKLFGDDSLEEASKKLFSYLENAQFEVKYGKRSKYLLFVVDVDENFDMSTERFGDMEDTDKMKHEYSWLEMKGLKLHYRLKDTFKERKG